MKKLLALVLLALPLAAQAPFHEYAYYKTTTLSASAETVTLQQPASGSKLVQGKAATIYCSVACTWTLSVDGTAATGTAGTALTISEGAPTATGDVFHTSDVGAGTTLAAYVLAAGEKLTIDISSIRMRSASTAKNISFATDSITGDASITLQWNEF